MTIDCEDSMAILSKEELVELTGGLKQGAAQIRWIERALASKRRGASMARR
ncbi:DUF4224 domain-containing protein [Burkholderia vietnamiensis]|nr:DUF4224 domain-containing protein [Burkholderia vietnamiensis]